MSPFSPETAAVLLIVLLVLPLLHVALSPKSGRWTPPPGTRCPFGPRTGWLMIVLIGGPLGWIAYLRGRGKNRPPPPPRQPTS